MSIGQDNGAMRLDWDTGFTLIEILLGLAIVSLTLVALQPLLRPANANRVLEASTRQLAASLRNARLKAIRDNREAGVSIHVHERAYFAEGIGTRHFLPSGIDITATTTTASMTGSNVTFRFFPDGSANGGNVRLSLGGHTSRLIIDWLSGHVRTEIGGAR